MLQQVTVHGALHNLRPWVVAQSRVHDTRLLVQLVLVLLVLAVEPLAQARLHRFAGARAGHPHPAMHTPTGPRSVCQVLG